MLKTGIEIQVGFN